jgi:hypothetical protein
MTTTPIGSELLVNTATAGFQGLQQITALANGGFVVTWADSSAGVGGASGDSSNSAVKAQVFLADGTRLGSELLVNTATASTQNNPHITALSNGGFVVTWEDSSAGVGGATGDSSSTAVKAQVFLADGTRVGPELLVNTATAGFQGVQQITALANGGFVVTWEDSSAGVGGAAGDSSSRAVKAQVFLADGTRVASELLVNTATAGFQGNPQITALANGGFVVTWPDQSLGDGGASGDSSNSAVKAQVFAADGTRVGSEFRVNTATTGFQGFPQITTLANGGFVVTWRDDSQGVGGATGDSSNSAVKAQVFAADGTRVGSELLVNTATANAQDRSQITALANGGFVATWEDGSAGSGGATGDSSGTAVKAQVFAADGTRVGSELLVNTATANGQDRPDITALANGAFVVTWQDSSAVAGGATGDGSDLAVKAQVFLADGTRVGSELLINTATANDQIQPQITALANGGFVVTWQDLSRGVGGATGDSNSFAVKAQVFAVSIIIGDGGNNVLAGTPGNDTIFGLGGDDTALFSGNRSSYTLQVVGSTLVISGLDGTDTLSAIERLQFADGTIKLDDGSALFDTPFYLSRNPDVVQAGVDALFHYNVVGFHEGRDPNAFFDTSGYLAINKDVAAAGVNPLDHFHQSGWKEGRDPSADFDTTLYLINNPDVAAAGIDPLEHFLQPGLSEGRKAFAAIGQTIVGGFDAEFYLFHNPDVAAAGIAPFFHYDIAGRFEGRDPNAWFDTSGYLAHYTDVAAAGIDPLLHYMAVGWAEGRDPSATFDTLGYLAANPDVAAAGMNPLDHFLRFGIYEGRQAINDGLFH